MKFNTNLNYKYNKDNPLPNLPFTFIPYKYKDSLINSEVFDKIKYEDYYSGNLVRVDIETNNRNDYNINFYYFIEHDVVVYHLHSRVKQDAIHWRHLKDNTPSAFIWKIIKDYANFEYIINELNDLNFKYDIDLINDKTKLSDFYNQFPVYNFRLNTSEDLYFDSIQTDGLLFDNDVMESIFYGISAAVLKRAREFQAVSHNDELKFYYSYNESCKETINGTVYYALFYFVLPVGDDLLYPAVVQLIRKGPDRVFDINSVNRTDCYSNETVQKILIDLASDMSFYFVNKVCGVTRPYYNW